MQGVLIADTDMDMQQWMSELLSKEGYSVTVTDSVATMLQGILKKIVQVVLLGSKFDDMSAFELIPLIKKCNRKLEIILVSDELSLPLMRKAHHEGIFYHALKPAKLEDSEEIRQAVQCAFKTHGA